MIFSGLARLSEDYENHLNWDYFELTNVDTVNRDRNLSKLQIEDQNEILLDQCFELEYVPTGSEEVITMCEKYLLNAQKLQVLENAVFYVPRIFLTFRPAYACQLSIRFIIKLLTGIEKPTGISYIIRKNCKELT